MYNQTIHLFRNLSNGQLLSDSDTRLNICKNATEQENRPMEKAEEQGVNDFSVSPSSAQLEQMIS